MFSPFCSPAPFSLSFSFSLAFLLFDFMMLKKIHVKAKYKYISSA